MPVRPTFPGVYIEEIPSGVRPITGVATSTAAFVGTFRKGLLDEAVQLLSIADFEREYGGLDRLSEASYAVQQFFLNGGTEAWVVRIAQPDPPVAPAANATTAATGTLSSFAPVTAIIDFFAGRRIRGESARNPGDWGNFLRLEVEHNSAAAEPTFNLFVSEVAVAGNRTTVLGTETFRNLTMAPDTANYAVEVVNQGSRLIQLTRASALGNLAPPAANGTISADLADPNAATDMDDLSITLNLTTPVATAVGPITLAFSGLPAIPAASPFSQGFYVAWAAALQSAVRGAGANAAVSPEQRAYFTGAAVDLIGHGSAANPRRFVIRAGKGAQPYDPGATLTFGAADAPNYGLAAPNVPTVGPQQFLPTAGSGADGDIVDPATGNYLVPAAAFRGSPLPPKTGLYALDDMDIVNIIALPDAARLGTDDARAVYAEGIAYAEKRRSMTIVDIPIDVVTIDQMQTWLASNESLRHPNAAVYYPRTFTPDPLRQNRQRSLASSGTIGGLWARTDASRGVWKAPAGTDARLRNVESLTYLMTDGENGTLNPLGINCLRNFPVYSNICWGARTLDGADTLASDWKYVPVRRTTLYIEESLYRGTKWVVFEPNDEPLWAQIRLNVGTFMQDLFRKGAFQGSTPREAFFVKCDGETTTQTDIDNGIVNIEVGFAPLKPAEFVIIKIQQIARVTSE
jgi:phage tail sheath protein FI